MQSFDTRSAKTVSLNWSLPFKFVAPPAASGGSTGKGILIGVTCTALLAVVGFGAAYWWMKVRRRQGLGDDNDIAMIESDALLLREP